MAKDSGRQGPSPFPTTHTLREDENRGNSKWTDGRMPENSPDLDCPVSLEGGETLGDERSRGGMSRGDLARGYDKLGMPAATVNSPDGRKGRG
jgi:hypothetical protein